MIPLGLVLLAGGAAGFVVLQRPQRAGVFQPNAARGPLVAEVELSPFQTRGVADLHRQVRAGIRYRDGYFQGGEPPAGIGVCTDVVIRAFRGAGVDLRQAVAEDIRQRRRAYASERPDRNIDHRRCRNLVAFFERHARSQPVSREASAWLPGDLVFWDTNADRRVDHVGVISNGRDRDGNPTVVHHWPGLPVSETDGLHRFPITHHFRWGDPTSRGERAAPSSPSGS